MKYTVCNYTDDGEDRAFADMRAAVRHARLRADATQAKHGLFATDGDFNFLVHEFEPITRPENAR